MKHILKVFSLLIACSLFLVSCEEDDPANPSIPESMKYGNILVTVSGNYPQGVPFTQTTDYKYMPENNFAYSSMDSGEDITFFTVLRKIGQTEFGSNDDIYAEVKFRIDSTGVEPEFLISLNTKMYVLNEEDNTYFRVLVQRADLDFQVTQFSFDPETSKLKFTMSTTIPAEENVGFASALQITVVGDVIVYRLIPYNSGT